MAEHYRAGSSGVSSETLLPGLEREIVTSRMLTPQDFQDRLLSFNGAAFGLEPVLTQSAWFRPHNSSEEVDRLYLVGAGTHPGAGLPGVLSSARVLDKVVPDAADIAAPLTLPTRRCRRVLRRESRTFHAASLLLPRTGAGAGLGALRVLPAGGRRGRLPGGPAAVERSTGCASGWSGSMRAGRCRCRSIARLPTWSSGSASRSGFWTPCSRVSSGISRAGGLRTWAISMPMRRGSPARSAP